VAVSLPMARANLRRALVELGWSGADVTADLRELQRGWNLGPQLVVDGRNGPLTREAVRKSLREHRAGRPDASPHFSFDEFSCRCGGRLPGCRRIVVQRQLLVALERYRASAGPTAVLSGYRCPAHNKAVGGASSSQHLFGSAADVSYRRSWHDVAALQVFGGIGRSKRTGLVRHVDVRQVSGHNTTGASTAQPTVWDYAA
jgi:zinc D-Ala-D-Ala carboxypeptidase